MFKSLKTAADLNVSTKHRKQIERASQRRLNAFVNKYIKPTIEGYLDDHLPGIPHLFASETGAFAHMDMEEYGFTGTESHTLRTEYTLFSNPLRLAAFDPTKRVSGRHSGFTPPGERITNAGWVVFTLEYDGATRADLEMQLDWFVGKRDTCQFSKVHRALSRYPDYRGYCAVFSGNKSVHIHLLFDTKHLDHTLKSGKNSKSKSTWTGDLPPEAFALVYRRVWSKLASLVNNKLGINVDFDARLQSCIQKRRIPWGHRVFSKPASLHGFETGDIIEQTVLQEHILTRSSAGPGKKSFIVAPCLDEINRTLRTSANKTSLDLVSVENEGRLLDLLVRYLRSNGWQAYPKPVKLFHDGVSHYLHFRNHPSDAHPSSFIRGDFRRVLFAGKGAPTDPMFLPNDLTLDETLELVAPPEVKAALEQPKLSFRNRLRVASKFAATVSSQTAGRAILANQMHHVASSPGVTLVQTGEGLGKTFSWMSHAMALNCDQDVERLLNAQRRGIPFEAAQGFVALATKSYQQAYEKAQEFLSDKLGFGPSRVVVLKSVSRLYAEARRELKVEAEVTRQAAGQDGYASLLHAIKAQQPNVFKQMCELRDEMWLNQIGEIHFDPCAFVVLVHDVLKAWPHSLYAKAFLHPEFPTDFNEETIKSCAQDMVIKRVAYDEVEATDLVAVYKKTDVEFAQKVADCCLGNTGKPWSEAGLPDRVKAYAKIATTLSSVPFGYDYCDGILRLGFTAKDEVRPKYQDYPFGHGSSTANIYRQIDGQILYVKARRWFHSLNCPVAILTTEDLPRMIVKGINEDQAHHPSKKCHIRILNLSVAPHMMVETVPLYFEESARMPRRGQPDLPSVSDLATALIDAGCDHIISNGLSGLPREQRAQTSSHKAVRGRNDLQAASIATILTYPSLDEYTNLCAIAARFSVQDPIAIAFRDMLFQDLGRNLGNRGHDGQSEVDHTVWMKPSLYKCLSRLKPQSVAVGSERYQLRLAD